MKEKIYRGDIYIKKTYIRKEHTMVGYTQGKIYVKSSIYIVETHMVGSWKRFIYDGINMQIVYIIIMK